MTVTAEMFDSLTAAVTSNATAIVPVGVAIMGVLVAVSLIPRILYKFL